VTPSVQLELDIFSKNVYVVEYREKKVKIEKDVKPVA
jgi:hypothetical protein